MSSTCKPTEEEKAARLADRKEETFLELGVQYYVAARAAALAQLVPVVGNLYHHSIEAFLKAWLSKKHPPEQLKDWGHRLPRLWDAFKTDFPGSGLEQFDDTVGSIDRFERLRYPDTKVEGKVQVIEQGAQIMIQWERSSFPIGQISGAMPPAHTVYGIIVNDIDRLVGKIFSTCSKNPWFFTGRLHLNDYARHALTHLNPIAKQLMKREP